MTTGRRRREAIYCARLRNYYNVINQGEEEEVEEKGQ